MASSPARLASPKEPSASLLISGIVPGRFAMITSPLSVGTGTAAKVDTGVSAEVSVAPSRLGGSAGALTGLALVARGADESSGSDTDSADMLLASLPNQLGHPDLEPSGLEDSPGCLGWPSTE
jgi:hypothetical protein